jgi:hypothetical protein
MIAYSKKDLQNLRIQDAVKADHGQGIINGTELKAIVEKYPVSF